MKNRSGFVSNSSSSSFIVSSKKGEHPTVVVEIELPYSEEVSNVDELREYFTDRHGQRGVSLDETLKNHDWLKKSYDDCVAELEKGNSLYFGSVSSEGDAQDQFLYEQGLGENVKGGTVIQDCR